MCDEDNFCVKGVVVPAPPCAPYCELYCPSIICESVGKCGYEPTSNPKFRGPVFLVLSFLSVCQFVLGIVGACGLSYTYTVLRDAPWAIAEVKVGDDTDTYYLGLSAIGYDISANITGMTSDGNSVTGTKGWEGFCNNIEANTGQDASDCTDCQNAGTSLFMTSIITVFSKVGQLGTDATRSTTQEDVACQKIFGMLTGVVGTISTLITINSWDANCYKAFPDEIGTYSVSVVHGAGFICFWLCTIGGIFDAFFHALVPLPPADAAKDLEENATVTVN